MEGCIGVLRGLNESFRKEMRFIGGIKKLQKDFIGLGSQCIREVSVELRFYEYPFPEAHVNPFEAPMRPLKNS